MDIALVLTEINGEKFKRLPADFATEKGDLKKNSDLENAILLSLFTDARALDSDVTPTDYRGGFWGDQVIGDQFNDFPKGSRLWILQRKGLSQATLNEARAMVLQALQWMINLKIVKSFDVIITGRSESDGFNLSITAQEPDLSLREFNYSYLWQQLKD